MTDSPERAWLDSLSFFGIKLGLENIKALLQDAGNPHRAVPVVHVAGTNGKGSTLAFLDAMLQSAGYRTGRFTSPHLMDVTERFLLDSIPIAAEALDDCLRKYRLICEAQQRIPTYFEVCTAVAFSVFAEAGVDIALIETGMGGRLDSTNVVDPIATAITSIGYDHMQYLGNTLAEIAAEKAGILKSVRPLIVGRLPVEAEEVIAARAGELNVLVRWLDRDFTVAVSGEPWRPIIQFSSASLTLDPALLGLAGFHQADNAAVACALAVEVRNDFPRLNPRAILDGLSNARWPCRLERVSDSPPIIMDAAHNPAGMAHYPVLFRRAVVLFAASADKDAAGMLAQVESFADPLILTEYAGGRSMPAPDLAALCKCPVVVLPSLKEALAEAMRCATPGNPLLITGSIFLAGEARAMLLASGHSVPVTFANINR